MSVSKNKILYLHLADVQRGMGVPAMMEADADKKRFKKQKHTNIMKTFLALITACLMGATCACAQDVAGSECCRRGTKDNVQVVRTFTNTGNPLVKDKFTADPAPMVHDGRLYLYVGHDEYYDGQDTASGGKEFNITEWLCYSTSDMQTWTDHGAVLCPADFS